MINAYKNLIELEFGNGDIGLSSGHYLGEGKSKIGVVTFENIIPREIGSLEICKEIRKINEFPIVMTFTKKESIDVVIRRLQDAKANME